MKTKSISRNMIEEIALEDVEALVVHCGSITPDDAINGNYDSLDIKKALKTHYQMCKERAYSYNKEGIITEEVAKTTRGSL